MTYRQIETSREARLWVTQVIMPTLVLTTTVVMATPELKAAATAKFKEVKSKIQNALHK